MSAKRSFSKRGSGWVSVPSIETSHRQRREARIRTCTRDPKMRLFYVGISLFLRNIWVFFHAIFFAV
jgi:hypothetical protein